MVHLTPDEIENPGDVHHCSFSGECRESDLITSDLIRKFLVTVECLLFNSGLFPFPN